MRTAPPLVIVVILLAGCRQQMAEQPYYRPLTASGFFDDGAAARPLVPGTIARGQLRLDRLRFLGLKPEAQVEPDVALNVARDDLQQTPYAEHYPFPLTAEVLRRGRERYQVFCLPCHDPLGYGRGVVVQRGYTVPPSYHSDRLRAAPPGYLYDVIRRGYGSMPDYREQIPVDDRWAIAAYVQALQLSQHARLAELTSPRRTAAEKQLSPSEGSNRHSDRSE